MCPPAAITVRELVAQVATPAATVTELEPLLLQMMVTPGALVVKVTVPVVMAAFATGVPVTVGGELTVAVNVVVSPA
jgi:hypothetical protein